MAGLLLANVDVGDRDDFQLGPWESRVYLRA